VDALQAAIFPIALSAHREAQGGGSGVDVAASVFGGVLCAELDAGGALNVHTHRLPRGVVVEVYASPVSALTRDLLARVRALREADPVRHRSCLDAAGAGARSAVAAGTPAELVRAVGLQTDALAALGEASGAPIVTAEVAVLRRAAEGLGATFAPSGAEGGDIAFFLGEEAAPSAFRALAAEMGLARIELAVGAEGAGPVQLT
jgi:phosphomevalonate kinase